MRAPKFPATLPDDARFFVDRHATALTGEMQEPIPFTPVPRQRTRRHGWTEDRQRGFIAALRRCGAVATAAEHVGLSKRSAYRLLDAPGAESFAAAWDAAVDEGITRLRCDALERAMHGGFVPVYRRGKLVRVEHRRNDKLAIAMLSGRPTDVDTYRRRALSRIEQRRDEDELQVARTEHFHRHAEADRLYQEKVDALIERVRFPEPPAPPVPGTGNPRIRAL